MASKNCLNCGSDNDLLFTNCQFCRTPLPIVDLNSISNEDLILNAGEWIGKLKEGEYIAYSANNNQWTGKGIITISKAQIQGYALKYLSLLQVRSANNSNLSLIYNNLQKQYDYNSKSLDSKTKKIILAVLFIIIMFYMMSRLISLI
ncbi:hypothetical protein [Pedobacter sp.]